MLLPRRPRVTPVNWAMIAASNCEKAVARNHVAHHRAHQPGRREPRDHRQAHRREAQLAGRVQQVAQHEPPRPPCRAVGRLGAVPEGDEAQASCNSPRANFTGVLGSKPRLARAHERREHQAEDQDVDGVDRLERAGRDFLRRGRRCPCPRCPGTFQSIANSGSCLCSSRSLSSTSRVNSSRAVVVAELLLGGLEARSCWPDLGGGDRCGRRTTRSTLRSVKLFSELPACSKNAQKSIEKKVRIKTTYIRWRAMRSRRKVSTTK